jgi:hypothetical protein
MTLSVFDCAKGFSKCKVSNDIERKPVVPLLSVRDEIDSNKDTDLVCIDSLIAVSMSLDLHNPHIDKSKYDISLQTEGFSAKGMRQVLSYLAMFCWVSLAGNAHV